MQTVADSVTQHTFPSVAKEQVLGQSLPEAEGCLVLPGVWGLVEYRFDQLASLTPGLAMFSSLIFSVCKLFLAPVP